MLKQKMENEIFASIKHIKNVINTQNLLYVANLCVAKKEVNNLVCGKERRVFCLQNQIKMLFG